MKRREVSPSDRDALQSAAHAERLARDRWRASLVALHQAIKMAAEQGASIRQIAMTIDRSHARVRQLLERD